MITILEVKKALAQLLRGAYPEYKLYGMEVTEGYKRPSFFIDVRQTGERDVNANYTEKSFYIGITYFQKKIDEYDNLKKVREIAELLRAKSRKNPKRLRCLQIGGRFLPIEDYSVSYTGTNNDILQIEFSIEFREARTVQEDLPYMQNVQINQKIKR